jgi:hypothetical protein
MSSHHHVKTNVHDASMIIIFNVIIYMLLDILLVAHTTDYVCAFLTTRM